MLSRSCFFTLYVSNTLKSVSLLSLSKAFSWSTKTRFSSRLYSIELSISCCRAKITSVHLLPFLKPICTSLSSGSTLYQGHCSRIFAYIVLVWLRSDIPLYAPLSLLLPFVFPDWYNYYTLPVFRDLSLIPGLLEYCGKPCDPGFSTC